MSNRSQGTVTIDTERCKGCQLCIPACRPGVLAMSVAVNQQGYAYPELSPGCTGCRACNDVCPDFVFVVYKMNREQTVGASIARSETGTL